MSVGISPGELQRILHKAHIRLFEMHYKAHAGHLGPNLSALDGLITLFHAIMDEDDRFVLSKGHAAGALYVTLWTLHLLSDADLDSFCAEGARLAGHPHGDLPSVRFPTGSLGHGPSLACGLALAARHTEQNRRVWCFCGDGEWQEGACWEALSFAVHHKLGNMTILIDVNGLQGFGTTSEVNSFENLPCRIESFGAHVVHADGHDPASILEALSLRSAESPNVVLLKTVKGKGLKNEGQVSCHYLPLSEEEYTALMAQGEKNA